MMKSSAHQCWVAVYGERVRVVNAHQHVASIASLGTVSVLNCSLRCQPSEHVITVHFPSRSSNHIINTGFGGQLVLTEPACNTTSSLVCSSDRVDGLAMPVHEIPNLVDNQHEANQNTLHSCRLTKKLQDEREHCKEELQRGTKVGGKDDSQPSEQFQCPSPGLHSSRESLSQQTLRMNLSSAVVEECKHHPQKKQLGWTI